MMRPYLLEFFVAFILDSLTLFYIVIFPFRSYALGMHGYVTLSHLLIATA
jgi:hypothetical protein